MAQGHARAKVLHRAVDSLDANLAATQLGVTISSLDLGWIGEPALALLIAPALAGLGSFAAAGAHAIAAGIAFVIITVFHIVLGELAPKSLALQRPERTALDVPTPWACRNSMISRTAFCSAQPATIRAARLAPMPVTSRNRPGSCSIRSNTCSPKARTRARAYTGPMPRIMPEPKYFSIPSKVVGGNVVTWAALNCSPG